MTKLSPSPSPPISSSPGEPGDALADAPLPEGHRGDPRDRGNGHASPSQSFDGKAASVIDLCGELCPFTFVRTKLALEELPMGALLRVIVDHEPATRNIPRSASEWGQEVLGVTGLSLRTWAIDLRKRVR